MTSQRDRIGPQRLCHKSRERSLTKSLQNSHGWYVPPLWLLQLRPLKRRGLTRTHLGAGAKLHHKRVTSQAPARRIKVTRRVRQAPTAGPGQTIRSVRFHPPQRQGWHTILINQHYLPRSCRGRTSAAEGLKARDSATHGHSATDSLMMGCHGTATPPLISVNVAPPSRSKVPSTWQFG